jgi:CheY-like chemotaxis protein
MRLEVGYGLEGALPDAEAKRIVSERMAPRFREVEFAGGLKPAVESIRKSPPDVVILDLMLPDVGGIEICRRLKQWPETREIPVVMVTAKGEESDVVTGLDKPGRLDVDHATGDLLVTVEVVVPTELDDAQRSAVEALASATPGSPRTHLGVEA